MTVAVERYSVWHKHETELTELSKKIEHIWRFPKVGVLLNHIETHGFGVLPV